MVRINFNTNINSSHYEPVGDESKPTDTDSCTYTCTALAFQKKNTALLQLLFEPQTRRSATKRLGTNSANCATQLTAIPSQLTESAASPAIISTFCTCIDSRRLLVRQATHSPTRHHTHRCLTSLVHLFFFLSPFRVRLISCVCPTCLQASCLPPRKREAEPQ